MEIYLCHMFVYRVLEKLNLIHVTGSEIVNLSMTTVVTIVGAGAVAFCWNMLQKRIRHSI